MTDETILIENLPDVRDINVLLEAIAGIGAQVERINRSTVKINGSTMLISALIMNTLKKSAHPIIFWARCLASINMQRYRFRAAAISEAVPLTSI